MYELIFLYKFIYEFLHLRLTLDAARDFGLGKSAWMTADPADRGEWLGPNDGGPRRVTRASSSDGRPRRVSLVKASEAARCEWRLAWRVTRALTSYTGLRKRLGLEPRRQSDSQTVGRCEWLRQGAGANDSVNGVWLEPRRVSYGKWLWPRRVTLASASQPGWKWAAARDSGYGEWRGAAASLSDSGLCESITAGLRATRAAATRHWPEVSDFVARCASHKTHGPLTARKYFRKENFAKFARKMPPPLPSHSISVEASLHGYCQGLIWYTIACKASSDTEVMQCKD